MSEMFRGGLTKNYSQDYVERKKYLDFLKKSGYDLLDTLYEKKLYGFVNDKYEAVSPTAQTISFGPYSGNIQGLNYVVDLFNNFRNFYLSKTSTSDLEVPLQIEGLIPKKSYVDYEKNYNLYIDTVSSVILQEAISTFRLRPVEFVDFVDFIDSVIFSDSMRGLSLTKSGYLLSKDSSVHETGLYVDMRPDLSAGTDAAKAELINDDSFECYVDFANEFGFSVDANSPWRLALNLQSPAAQSNILNSRPSASFLNLYSDMYTQKVALDDFGALKNAYKSVYLRFQELRGLSGPSRDLANAFNLSKSRLLESLLLNKFKDLGLMTSSTRSQLFKDTLNKVLDINDRFRLISISGPIHYINSFSAQQLKAIILLEQN
jgi:hypothetical protein